MQSNRRGVPRETFGLRSLAVAAVGALALSSVAALSSTAPASAADTAAGGSCASSSLASANFDDSTLGDLQQDGNPSSLTYERVAGDAAGDLSLRVNGRTADYFGVQTAGLSSLKAGDVVTVSAKVRLAAGTAGTTTAKIVANDGTYATVGAQQDVTAAGWTTIGGTYTVPSGLDTSTLKFYVGTAALPGVASYDYDVNDFSVTSCDSTGGGTSTAPAPDCGTAGYSDADPLINSTFEDDTTDGWTPRADSKGSATLSVVPDPADSSNHALAVTHRGTQGQGPLHDVTCVVKPTNTYSFSADIRFASGAPTDSVVLSLANTIAGSTGFTNLLTFSNVTNAGWTHVSGKFTMPAYNKADLYLETKYSSTDPIANTSDLLFDNLQLTPVDVTVQDITPIKDTLPFPVGAAVSDPQISGKPGELLAKHFDQVTSENAMKVESWYNADHSFKATNADADLLMSYAQANGMRVYGHNLSWYQQTPDWFFQRDDGTPLTNSAADQQILRDRLDTHIKNVAQYLAKFGAFGSPENPLVSFDVVNEAVSDNVGDPEDLRQSRWYQVLGSEYIEDTFQDADKYFNRTPADGGYAAAGSHRPIALFYNDYNTEQAGKRARVQELITKLIGDNVPIDGVGHQFHVTMSTPVSSLQDAIEAFQKEKTAASAGGHELYQAVTELDVPTGTPVTEANLIDQGYYYKDVFDMLRSEWKQDPDIFCATVWGLVDSQSWRASSGAPLLFDDNLQAKYAYYGATDQALPAAQRSAIVFKQDSSDVDASSSASAADVTGNVEWSQLPLHSVGENAGFQLRWSGDHLTAYVTSTDATAEATDAATITWGDASSPSTATVKRDGTVTGAAGVTAKVTSTGTGWKAVVDLPTDSLTATSAPSFDVSVTDGADTTGWNTQGALGTLQLVEPLSTTTIPEATTTPTIDGVKDGAWNDASVVTPAKLIQGAGSDTTAKIYQLWQGQYLYVLADVTDSTPTNTSGNAYERDSVEIFTDPGNAKNGSYRADDAQMRIGRNGDVSFGGGDSEAAQQARLDYQVKSTASGYVVEARIDLKDGNTGVGKFEGLDYEINDGSGAVRVANYGWAEQTGQAYQTTSRWGVGELVGPSTFAPVITTQPAATTGHAGATVTFSAAADAKPVATVQWQRKASDGAAWTPVPGATAPKLSVKVNASLDGSRYRAVFTNPVGSTATDAATLTVQRGKPSA